MAINFLNTVAFNQNSLEKPRIENQPNDAAAGTGVVGQLYFDTTSDTLKQYVSDTGGGAAGWIEVGATSAVESIIAGTGIGVNAAIGNVTVRNTGLVTVLDGTYIDLTKGGGGDNTQLTADLSAVDGTSTAADRFLTKNNKWATIPFGDITEVKESTDNNRLGIDVVNPTGPIPIVGLDIVGRTNLGATPAGGDELLIYDTSTTTNKAITVSNLVGGFETTYDLTTAPTGTAVRLTGSDSTNDDVTISGTSGQTAMSRQSATELRVALTDDVTIISDLTVGDNLTLTGGNLSVTGTGSFTGEVTVPTAVAGTSAPNLAQVELLIAGVGVFKGGYSAATNPGTPKISGGSNIALDQGDYFVVTGDGDITFSDKTVTVEVGDFIFANAGITASSTPASTQYTIIIADANLATAGTLTGAKRGVAGFDATNFDVTVGAGNDPGFVTLKKQANPYSISVPLTSGTDSGGETTFTVDITTAARFGSGALAANCIATVKETTSSLIVYPKVTGNGTGSLDFKFIPTVANSVYTALITIV